MLQKRSAEAKAKARLLASDSENAETILSFIEANGFAELKSCMPPIHLLVTFV